MILDVARMQSPSKQTNNQLGEQQFRVWNVLI